MLADNLERQLAHWMSAARSFLDAEAFASRTAWESLENTIGLPIRTQLARSVDELIRSGRAAADVVRGSRTDPAGLPAAQAALQRFRRLYLQVETTLDFFGQAVNSRTSPQLRATMQALDRLARQSIETTLRPLGITVPPVLTYIGDGLGASIIRAGIRLWAPGTVNPVAAIKIVRHNLYRPTSLFHETGHQVAHLTGWNDALATGLGQALADDPPLRSMWQPWASEIAADVYAFALTGYASVAALYNVVADDRTILRWPLGDPHPIGWLRTLLGCAMCRHVYGAGPREAEGVGSSGAIEIHQRENSFPAVSVDHVRNHARWGRAIDDLTRKRLHAQQGQTQHQFHVSLLRFNYSPALLTQGFGGIGGHFADVDEFVRAHAGWRGEACHAMSPARDEVQPPHAIAQQVVKLVPEADHHVDRIDGVRAGVGPIGPVVVAIHSSQRVNLETFGDRRLIARKGADG